MNAPWLIVARREVVAKLTDRTFIVSTLALLGLIAGVIGVQAWLGSRTTTYAVVTSSDAARAMGDQVRDAIAATDDNARLTITEKSGDDAARAAVRDGDADAWLHQGDNGWVLTGDADVDGDLLSATSTAVRDSVLTANAAAAGTSVDALARGSAVTTAVLNGDADRATVAKALGFVLGMLFYLASFIFGLTLANSVVEEKSSRIVEIITAKIPVNQLLAGKVIGNLVLAVGQMAAFLVVGLIGLTFTSYDRYLPAISGALGWGIVFFVVGFGLLACLWAVAGSLASRTEDVQATSTPLTVFTMIIFFSTFFVDGAVRTVLSFTPPFSAILMPVRVLEGSAAWWEAVIALALLVVAAALVVRIAARLYRRSLLQTQGRLSLRQAWTAAE